MQQTDFARFRDVMRMMGTIYAKEPDAVMLDAYWLALRSWSLVDFENAAGLLMSSAKFFPRPADFNELKKSAEATTGEAWAIALAKCTCWRTGETPGGRIDRAARAIGGYRAIAMANIESDLPHLERRFKEAYEELSEVEDTRLALGFNEAHALLESKAEPKKIGVTIYPESIKDLI